MCLSDSGANALLGFELFPTFFINYLKHYPNILKVRDRLGSTIFSKEAFLTPRLGRGGYSCVAIALARRLKILTDDLDERKHAQRFSVPASDTIGILVLTVNKKLFRENKGISHYQK